MKLSTRVLTGPVATVGLLLAVIAPFASSVVLAVAGVVLLAAAVGAVCWLLGLHQGRTEGRDITEALRTALEVRNRADARVWSTPPEGTRPYDWAGVNPDAGRGNAA